MKRPKGVAWSGVLMLAALIIDCSVAVVQLLQNLQHPLRVAGLAPNHSALFLFGLSALYMAVGGFAVSSFYKGHATGRILILLGCAMELVYVSGVPAMWTVSRWSAAYALLKAALAVFLLFYLFRPDVRAWFGARAALRTLPAI